MNVQVVEDTSSGCGSSYSVFIVSDDFEGKNTLARHKLGKWLFALVVFLAIITEIVTDLWVVNEVLKAHIAEMHAFSQVSSISLI
jgi:stress-induced morphogen